MFFVYKKERHIVVRNVSLNFHGESKFYSQILYTFLFVFGFGLGVFICA